MARVSPRMSGFRRWPRRRAEGPSVHPATADVDDGPAPIRRSAHGTIADVVPRSWQGGGPLLARGTRHWSSQVSRCVWAWAEPAW